MIVVFAGMICRPVIQRLGFGMPAVKNVVHQIEQTSGKGVAGNQRHNQPMGKCARMAPGADPHADVAVGSHFSPVVETGFIVQFPAKSPAIKPVRDSLEKPTPLGSVQLFLDRSIDLGSLDIDHDVSAVDGVKGGPVEASRLLERFISLRLKDYDQLRNHPDLEATSELSPYLHFGHISAHQILHEIAVKESWTPERLSGTRSGQRKGWWGLSESAESWGRMKIAHSSSNSRARVSSLFNFPRSWQQRFIASTSRSN